MFVRAALLNLTFQGGVDDVVRMRMCLDVAKAMNYLASMLFIHRGWRLKTSKALMGRSCSTQLSRRGKSPNQAQRFRPGS
jgi:hypothetical protein